MNSILSTFLFICMFLVFCFHTQIPFSATSPMHLPVSPHIFLQHRVPTHLDFQNISYLFLFRLLRTLLPIFTQLPRLFIKSKFQFSFFHQLSTDRGGRRRNTWHVSLWDNILFTGVFMFVLCISNPALRKLMGITTSELFLPTIFRGFNSVILEVHWFLT